jgi:hypothetical protein
MTGAGRTTTAAPWAAGALLSCMVAPLPAHAQSWTIQRSLETSIETNDNYALSVAPAGRVDTLSVSGAFGAARLTESSGTRVDVNLAGFKVSGATGQDRIDGRLSLGQTLSAPLDSFTLGVNAGQDETLDTTRSSSDISLGRGRRRSAGGSASWAHSFTERLSASVQGSASRTVYRQLAEATNFQTVGASGGLQYRLSETDSLSLNLGSSRYRTQDDRARSSTDDYSVGVSRALSESSSASFSIGGYRTVTTALQPVLACPLQFSLCAAGLVPFIVVQRAGESRRSGLQFSAAVRQRLGEVTDVGIQVSRQQAPSGAGVVVRSESASVNLGHAFAPGLDGSLGYAESRTVFEGEADSPQPRLQTFSASLSKALAPEVNLRAAYQFRRSSESNSGSAARSNAVTVALRVEWPRTELGR